MTQSQNNQKYNSTAESVFVLALQILQRWTDEKRGLDDLLDEVSVKHLRAVVADILFQYFRHKKFIDQLIKTHCFSSPKATYQRALAILTTQFLFQNGIAKQSAVNIGVEVIKRKYGKKAGGFINALMRKIISDNPGNAVENLRGNPEKLLPSGLLKKWRKTFLQAEIIDMSRAINTQAQLTFRAREDIALEELEEVKASPVNNLPWDNCFKFYQTSSPAALFKKDWLEKGKIYIQDPATSLAPSLFELKGAETVLDLCAAPGGKSLMLLDRLKGNGKLFATDRSTARQRLTQENLAKSTYSNYEIMCKSVEELSLQAASFDAILADVPCSNTGVLRHRPDAMWRLSSKQMGKIVKLQRQIIAQAIPLLALGGQFIYSTCSITPTEDEEQVEWLQAEFPDMRLKVCKKIMPTTTWDGAFAALLIKT